MNNAPPTFLRTAGSSCHCRSCHSGQGKTIFVKRDMNVTKVMLFGERYVTSTNRLAASTKFRATANHSYGASWSIARFYAILAQEVWVAFSSSNESVLFGIRALGKPPGDLSNAAPLQFFGSPVRLQEAAVRRMLSRLDMCDTWTFCLHLCAHPMLQAAIP